MDKGCATERVENIDATLAEYGIADKSIDEETAKKQLAKVKDFTKSLSGRF